MHSIQLEAELLAFLARQHAKNGDAPVHMQEFCAESGHGFEAVRPVVLALFAQDLVSTFIGNEYAWLTPAGLAQASAGPSRADDHAAARALLGAYVATLAASKDPRAAHWSLALREMAADDAALAQLQALLPKA